MLPRHENLIESTIFCMEDHHTGLKNLSNKPVHGLAYPLKPASLPDGFAHLDE